MANLYDLIDIYAKEMEDDTTINILNLRDKQFSSPNIKHKWLYRLVMSKKQRNELLQKKEDIFNKKTIGLPLSLSKASIKAKFEKDIDIMDLNKEIEKLELLIEYLESAINKIFTAMSFDFKTIVEILKMEEL